MAVATSARGRRVAATRERIVDATLAMFLADGFGPTTIEAIAGRAGIGRRTFFRYFPSKEAVLFADFGARQRWALDALAARSPDEPPLTSLLAVFAGLCARPVDRHRREAVRAIVAHQPELLGVERRVTVSEFEEKLVAALVSRSDGTLSEEEARVLTANALACVESAWRIQMGTGRASLSTSFAHIVDTCATHWSAVDPDCAAVATPASRRAG